MQLWIRLQNRHSQEMYWSTAAQAVFLPSFIPSIPHKVWTAVCKYDTVLRFAYHIYELSTASISRDTFMICVAAVTEIGLKCKSRYMRADGLFTANSRVCPCGLLNTVIVVAASRLSKLCHATILQVCILDTFTYGLWSATTQKVRDSSTPPKRGNALHSPKHYRRLSICRQMRCDVFRVPSMAIAVQTVHPAGPVYGLLLWIYGLD